MKKSNLLFSIFTALLFCGVIMIMSNCEGPEGPEGPSGADGTNGTNGVNGTDGTPGVDGKVTCLVCHTSANRTKKAIEFTGSQHASGDIAVDYAGGRASCGRCHSHEGYVEFALKGSNANNYSNPSPWVCSTCHNLHTSFDTTDYAFRLGTAVTLMADGSTVIDEGNNNVCIHCHQSRRNGSYYDKETTDKTYKRKFTGADTVAYEHAAVGPAGSANQIGDTLFVEFDVPMANVYISSTHAGPHYGAQGNTWKGVGGYTATAGTPFSPHSPGCVKCHMGDASGHSFKPDLDNCTGCHGDKTSVMDAIETRLEAIAVELENIHAIHEDDGYHPMYASLTRDEFQAFWNFMIVLVDRSNSAHNPTYVKALLSEAETKLGM